MAGLMLSISGCVGTGNINQSRFKPYVDLKGTEYFDFETDSSVFSNDIDEKGETSRLDILNKWLNNSGYCQNGHEIIYRKSISLGGPQGYARIFYTGKCK